MKLNELVPGTKVDIKKEIGRGADAQAMSYTSSVFDVTDDNEIIINMPSSGGKMVVLSTGLSYEFAFTTSAGIFMSSGVVVRRSKQGVFYLLAIRLTGKLTKLQRREYYRMECMMPLIYQSVLAESAKEETIEAVRDAMAKEEIDIRYRGMGTIMDISGGGIRFQCTETLQDVTHLLFSFQIVVNEKKRQVEVVGRLLHSEFKEQAQRYEHRAEFIYKDGISSDDIIKYIFDEERRVRGIGR